MSELRRQWIYPSNADERYRDGGLHAELSAEELYARHQNDPHSFLLIAHREGESSDQLCAYLRITAPQNTAPQNDGICEGANARAKVHVLVADPQLCGISHNWVLSNLQFSGKCGQILYERAFAFARDRGCTSAVAEVAVAPIPNLAALAIHRSLGFGPDGPRNLVSVEYDNAKSVHFVRLVRHL